jgi:uncharacterized membrane protein
VPTFENDREVDRVIFFSDAVFAIAMTLLAFGIRVPVVRTAQVGSAIRGLAGPIAGYFLTFAVVGLYWMAHHRMFQHLRRVDTGLIVLNLVLLALIALMPVPTDLLGRATTTASVIFYAVTVSCVGLASTAVWVYATRHHRLVSPDLPHDLVVSATLRAISVPAVFLLSVPIALVDPHAAMYFWLVLVVVRVVFRHRLRS